MIGVCYCYKWRKRHSIAPRETRSEPFCLSLMQQLSSPIHSSSSSSRAAFYFQFLIAGHYAPPLCAARIIHICDHIYLRAAFMPARLHGWPLNKAINSHSHNANFLSRCARSVQCMDPNRGKSNWRFFFQTGPRQQQQQARRWFVICGDGILFLLKRTPATPQVKMLQTAQLTNGSAVYSISLACVMWVAILDSKNYKARFQPEEVEI